MFYQCKNKVWFLSRFSGILLAMETPEENGTENMQLFLTEDIIFAVCKKVGKTGCYCLIKRRSK